MTINLYFALTLVVFFMLILPTTLVFALKHKPRTLKWSISILFVIYLFLLFVGTAGKVSLKNNTLNIYFNFSGNWFSLYFLWFSFSKTNALINLFLLFPVGYLVYTFCEKHKFIKTILLALAISLFIEIYQWVLPIHRNTELSDILFNTISGLVSAIYCNLLLRFGAFKTNKKHG